MDLTEKLANELLKSHEIAMVPYNPNPTDEHTKLYNHLNTVHKRKIYLELLKYMDNPNFSSAMDIVHHSKGKFVYFDEQTNFNDFMKFKNWLDDTSITSYRTFFVHKYGELVINGEIRELDMAMLNQILLKDVYMYFDVAKKLKISDAGRKIFEHYPNLIFNWLNQSKDVYNELVRLNQHNYILSNMNGNLDITEGAMRYVIEFAQPNVDMYILMKRQIGLKRFWELSNYKFSPEFYANVVESLNDLVFIINIDNIGLESMENILKIVKDKFPLIYENFNSLLFLKKEFNNK